MNTKRKARCTAVIDTMCGNGPDVIPAGRCGYILGTRNLSGRDREYLIKWDRRSGPCSHKAIGIDIIHQ